MAAVAAAAGREPPSSRPLRGRPTRQAGGSERPARPPARAPALTVSDAGSPLPSDMAAALPGRPSALRPPLSDPGAPQTARPPTASGPARAPAATPLPWQPRRPASPGCGARAPGPQCACSASPAGRRAALPEVRARDPRRARQFPGCVPALLLRAPPED